MHGLWSLGTPGNVSLVPMSLTKSASTMGLFSDVNSRFPSIKKSGKVPEHLIGEENHKGTAKLVPNLARIITKGWPNRSPIAV